ncbi:hypothetical protein JOM56_013702 [Amanita muscaria]
MEAREAYTNLQAGISVDPRGGTTSSNNARKRKRLSLEEQVPDEFNGATASDNELSPPFLPQSDPSPSASNPNPSLSFQDTTYNESDNENETLPIDSNLPTEQEQNNHVNSSNPLPKAQLSNLQLAQEMIQNVQDARLEDDIVDEDLLASLCNPPKDDVKITPLMRFCLKVFLSLSAACSIRRI